MSKERRERPPQGWGIPRSVLRQKVPQDAQVFLGRATKFFQEIVNSGAVSHVGIVGYRDDVGYSNVDIYTLTSFPLKIGHLSPEDDRKLSALYNAVVEHLPLLEKPGFFIRHHLIDPEKYTPKQLREELEEACKGRGKKFGMKLLEFEPVSKLLPTSA